MSGALPVATAIASASCDERRGRGELPGEHVHARPVDECDGKQGERAGIPSQLHRPSGERVERVVVPELEHRHRLDDRRQQQPAHDLPVIVERLVPDRLEREPERRHARAGSLRAPARQAVEHEVDRSRRRRRDGAARAASALSTPESASRRPEYMAAPSASR